MIQRSKAFLIVNPIAGRGKALRKADTFCACAADLGMECEVASTQQHGDATQFAASAPDDADCIVSVGGDGTLNEVLNGIRRLARRLPVVLLSQGTANVVSRELGLPRRPEDLARLAVDGATRTIDIGRVNGRLFALTAGVGFDADAVARVHRRRKGAITMASYIGAGLAALLHYPSLPPLTVVADGKILCDDSRYVVVCNTRRYGGPLVFTPEARPDDGELDICAFRGSRRFDAVQYLLGALMGGRHVAWSSVIHTRAKEVSLRSTTGEPSPVQVDGDIGPALPLEISVIPEAVDFIVPASPGVDT